MWYTLSGMLIGTDGTCCTHWIWGEPISGQTHSCINYIPSYGYKYAVLQRPRKCECFMQYRCKTTICLINVAIASEHRNETCKHMIFFSLDIHVDQNKPAFEPSGISQIINLHKSRFHLTNQKKVSSFK